MLATINYETSVKYFNNAPLLTIPGFAHPVTDNYLEDILSVVDYRPPVCDRARVQLNNKIFGRNIRPRAFKRLSPSRLRVSYGRTGSIIK